MDLLRASLPAALRKRVRLDLKAAVMPRPHTDHTRTIYREGSGARRFRALSWAARDGIWGMIAANRLPWDCVTITLTWPSDLAADPQVVAVQLD
jgi:hypothetical protein